MGKRHQKPDVPPELEQLMKDRLAHARSEMSRRYRSRRCIGCGRQFSLLKYLARRGHLRGRLPEHCEPCAELTGFPWLSQIGKYKQKVDGPPSTEES